MISIKQALDVFRLVTAICALVAGICFWDLTHWNCGECNLSFEQLSAHWSFWPLVTCLPLLGGLLLLEGILEGGVQRLSSNKKS